MSLLDIKDDQVNAGKIAKGLLLVITDVSALDRIPVTTQDLEVLEAAAQLVLDRVRARRQKGFGLKIIK